MRSRPGRRLRMVDKDAQSSGVEPLRALVQSAMDAAGLIPADVTRLTGISSQNLSLLLRREKPYGSRPPSIDTMQRLEKVPGLSQRAIARAVAESIGLVVTVDVNDATPLRRSVHNMVDKFPEDELPRVLQILIAMFD